MFARAGDRPDIQSLLIAVDFGIPIDPPTRRDAGSRP
jgi:hypothetical protein